MHAQSSELETFLKMAVFQYMIGNTDWSAEFLHNIKAIAFDSLSIPSVVPYDFDHAGIVDAPYALPAEQLQLTSIRERRFRGYCIFDMNLLKPQFYAVYTSCPLLDAKYVSSTIKYLDQFYETLNNPKKLAAEFHYPCDGSASGVIIGGMGTKETDE